MKKILTLILIIVSLTKIIGQEKKIPQDPQDAKFETSDIQNFWKAFDAINNSNGNPFETYIKNGTIGLQGFIPNRIISADSLLIMVNRRKQDYEKIRGIEIKIKEQEKRIKPYFYALEYWYPYAVYPPVYFVVGRFNSGGTLSENGLLIGTEKLTSLDYLPELVIHESIHFQQKNPEGGETNLLQQSILEGMADFIAELVTGIKGNQEANKYGNEHKEELCREFVEKMYGNDIQDWLYGTSGKDNRPNDLGYWIGYEIVKAYFEKSDDKKLAVNHILNIEDYDRFLRDSGYLEKYMKLSNVGQKQMSYKIETSDIANFWVAFDSIKRSDNKAEVFRKLYLEKASDLFKKMISMSGDIRNPENYLESFEKYPKFWESLRKPTMALQNISLDIESCFEKVKSIYPKFKAGDVCVFVGPLSIQGSVRDKIIFLGAEMNVPLNEIDLSEFEEDMSFIYQNDIKSTIIHETIHLQQKGKSKNLLQLTIREGSADFLAELFLGEPYTSTIYDYGKKNESILWKEFSKELDSEDWNKWFYAKSKTKERPIDLGYFIGYMITKSYYDKAKDKNKAVQEIIEVTDVHKFLEISGYAEKFKK